MLAWLWHFLGERDALFGIKYPWHICRYSVWCGWFADRIGFRTTAIFKLIVAATLFVPSSEFGYGPSRCYSSLPMSITLASLANVLPNTEAAVSRTGQFLTGCRCVACARGIQVRHPAMLSEYQFGLGTCVGRRSYVSQRFRGWGHLVMSVCSRRWLLRLSQRKMFIAEPSDQLLGLRLKTVCG